MPPAACELARFWLHSRRRRREAACERARRQRRTSLNTTDTAPARPSHANPSAEPPCAAAPVRGATAAWLIALLGWTALIAFYQLDAPVGFEPIDCWVAQTAREMSESADVRGYILPHFSGEARLQKSPGPYWAVIGAAWLRGGVLDEAAARLPNAVFTVLMALTSFWLTRRIAGDRAAVFAGFATSSCAIVLYWSHRGASDLGVSALMALSLAALWIGSETYPRNSRRQIACWMLGYLAAGLAMLYKQPMPLVCVGLPALAYVLLCNRWSIFLSRWHLLGLALFCLPWLPWALAVLQMEPNAILKWKAEYLDRATGELPNVEAQKHWSWYFFYLGVMFAFALPWSLSIPAAIARGLRPPQGAHRLGMRFLLIWLASLLLFFSAATGKETRYFLPAMPPLLMLLGVELARFFDPQRRASATLDRVGALVVCVGLPAAAVAAFYYGRRVLARYGEFAPLRWDEVWPGAAVCAAIIVLGAAAAALLYLRRREHAAFGCLVGMMWAAWLYAWPALLPKLTSEAPFRDLAAQLRALTAEQQRALRHVGHPESRLVWYSDVRAPRVLDSMELIARQGGKRDLEFEKRLIAEEMVRRLEQPELALFIADPEHYIGFHELVPPELEKQGRRMPRTHVWLTARVGRPDRRFVVFGNQPPPWAEPGVLLHELKRRRDGATGAASQPATSRSAAR